MTSTSVGEHRTSASRLSGSDLPEALQEPTRAVHFGFQSLLCLANTVCWLGLLPVGQILLPLQVTAIDPVNKVGSLAIVTVLGALTALITNPLAGALSDRTTSRLGRRRPWLIVGTLLAAATLALMATASTIAALVLWWALFHIAINAVLAALTAVIPDQVPVRQRATVSGFVSLSLSLGAVIGVLLVTRVVKTPPLAYYVLAGVLLVVMLLFVLLVRDQPLPKGVLPDFKLRAFLASFWINPFSSPDFGWAWLTRFLVFLSYSASLGYLLFFLQDVVHLPNAAQGVATFQIIVTCTVLVSAILSGIFSDKLQRRKIFVMSASLILAFAFLLLAFFHSWLAVEGAAALVGLGFGAYLGVDIALITQVLPSASDRGKDLGVINIANAFPQVVGPAIAAFAINAFHSYTVLFILGAVLASLSALLVQRITQVQ